MNEKSFLPLQCEADGYPPPNITWTKLSGNIVIGRSKSYKFTSVQKGDRGYYLCTASNGFGDDADATFYVDVLCEFWEEKNLYMYRIYSKKRLPDKAPPPIKRRI